MMMMVTKSAESYKTMEEGEDERESRMVLLSK